MKGPKAEVTQVLNARPEVVYGIIRDYRNEHPQILPKPYFKSLVVLQGGLGAGTVVRVGMLGSKTDLHLTVTEPEPGRVLQEADAKAGVVTHFIVNPVDGGKRCSVSITTEWAPKPGLAGLSERLFNPLSGRYVFGKELKLLEARAQSKGA